MRLRNSFACVGLSTLVAVHARASVVAHYTFDETSGTVAHDSVGGVNGTLSGGVTFVGGGISGNAVSFTAGGGGLINMGNNFGGLPTAAAGFTLSAWVKNADTTGVIPVSKHNAGSFNGYLLHENDIQSGTGAAANNHAAAYVSSTGSNQPVSSTVVNDNVFHLLTETYVPGGQLTLYVDGVSQGSKPADTYVANTSAFVVGGFGQRDGNGVPESQYVGLVDDVQLYNTALSSNDVAYLFAHPGAVTPEPAALTTLAGVALLTARRRSKAVT